jgi:hypothetical protein
VLAGRECALKVVNGFAEKISELASLRDEIYAKMTPGLLAQLYLKDVITIIIGYRYSYYGFR